ncbi:MAG: VWA domain-containing protein [Candidatus Sulfotelmatobacter sp.]
MPASGQVVVAVKVNLFVLFFLVLLSAALSAQTNVDDVHVVSRQMKPESGAVQLAENSLPLIRSNVQLVLVPVSVTDSMERFVTGLSQDNFRVFDNNKLQKIQNFSMEDAPVSLGIILDMSGSMGDKIERIRDAVNRFCEAANPQDEFFMIVFADEPKLAVDFTSNTTEIEKELVFNQPKGRTALLDAIYMGLHKMKHAKYGKKALLIISDGGDNHSRYGENKIKSLARESDVMIYSIGIFDRYVPTQEEMMGPQLLSEIAAPSGGRSYTIDNPNQMPAVARHIGMELRTQYVLAYRPQDPPRNGKWRKIRVKLLLPRRFPFLRARAKTGYYGASG